jgi:hypothetical protein
LSRDFVTKNFNICDKKLGLARKASVQAIFYVTNICDKICVFLRFDSFRELKRVFALIFNIYKKMDYIFEAELSGHF